MSKKEKDEVYVFSAKGGQKFTGRITKKDGNTGFAVTDPNGEPLPEEKYEFNTSLKGSLTKPGDYKITLSTFEERDSKHTLAVRVTNTQTANSCHASSVSLPLPLK